MTAHESPSLISQPLTLHIMSQSFRLHCSSVFAAAFALVLLTAARSEEGATTVKFSDPAKPGTLKIVVGRGDLRIKGGDTAEISVKSELKPVTAKPRKDGLRVLTASSSFTLNEKDNIVTLDALSEGWAGAPADFSIAVPRTTTVVVTSSYGGATTLAGVSGHLEIKNTDG